VHKLLLVHKQTGDDDPISEAKVRYDTASAGNLVPWRYRPLEDNDDINI
jgi:hypothetical protein